jgi:hypothetical protein
VAEFASSVTRGTLHLARLGYRATPPAILPICFPKASRTASLKPRFARQLTLRAFCLAPPPLIAVERVGAYDPAKKVWTSKQTGTEGEDKSSCTVVEEQVGPGVFRTHFTESRVGKKSLPDLTVTCTSAIAAPANALKELDYLAGEWDYDGYEMTTKEPMGGRCVYRWVPGKHCLAWEQTWIDTTGLSHGSGLIGWDPTTGGLIDQDI